MANGPLCNAGYFDGPPCGYAADVRDDGTYRERCHEHGNPDDGVGRGRLSAVGTRPTHRYMYRDGALFCTIHGSECEKAGRMK